MFTLAAFIGWQMGAGTGKKFGEYLEELNLVKKQATAEATGASGDKGLTAAGAIKKAEVILAMAKKKESAI